MTTAPPAATGKGFASLDAGVLDLFGDVTGGTDAGLLGLSVFFSIDDIGADFELGTETVAVTVVGFSGQTLEFLLADTLSRFPNGLLLSITGGVLAGIDGYADLDSF